MNIHKNARLTPRSRGELVRRVLVERQSPMSVATDMGVSLRTVRKWVARYQVEGGAGLTDRSSRPHRRRRPTPPVVIERIEALRRQRWTGKRIAMAVGVSTATVSRVLISCPIYIPNRLWMPKNEISRKHMKVLCPNASRAVLSRPGAAPLTAKTRVRVP